MNDMFIFIFIEAFIVIHCYFSGIAGHVVNKKRSDSCI